MHIPDGYLSPATAGTLYAAAAPFWYIASRKTKAVLSGRLVPLMALLSAFCFVIQMINVPLPGGTTGHAVGASLAAIILTPWPAVVAVSIALIIQALFFGDGGITAIGANCLNMAVIQVFVAYYIYRTISARSARGQRVAAGIAAYLSMIVSGFVAAVELGIQPALAHAADGTPLYAPYSLSITLPAVVGGHLLAGIAEAIVTAGTIAFLQHSAPELLNVVTRRQDDLLPGFWARMRLAWILLACLVFLTPLGLLAPGTAWGEWTAEQLRDTGLNFVPQGMQKWESFWQAAFSDYAIPGLGEQTGYVVSALLGIALIALVSYLLTFLGKRSESSKT
jgi:cobalt/nickel transport system permease protein